MTMTEYTVTKQEWHSYEVYDLNEASTGSSVRVCPERGGIVLGFASRGKQLLYLDEATFRDPSTNIRGGIPVLFPICGPLAGGGYEWEGERYEMKQHGLARSLAWDVVKTDTDGRAALTLRLRATPETFAAYPFDFELLFTYALKDGALTIEQTYANRSEREMPFYAGFHPYFVADTKHPAYATDAARCLDMNDRQEKPFDGAFDLTELTESVILLDAHTPAISFAAAEAMPIELAYSERFKYVVLWTVPGQPFLCVEPWMAMPGELNAKRELPILEPGGSMQAFMKIALR